MNHLNNFGWGLYLLVYDSLHLFSQNILFIFVLKWFIIFINLKSKADKRTKKKQRKLFQSIYSRKPAVSSFLFCKFTNRFFNNYENINYVIKPVWLYIIYADLWNLFLSSFHLLVIPFLYHVWSMKNYIFFYESHGFSIDNTSFLLLTARWRGTNASEKLKLFNHNSFMHGGDGDWLVPLVAVDRHIMAYIWWAWLEQKQISCNAQSNDQYY